MNRTLFFVDLPGFGYAKAGKIAVRKWKDLIERYFHKQSTIALVVQLIDSRMPPTGMDMQLSEWMDKLQLPRIVVATKSDKLSNNQKSLQSRLISQSMGGRSVVMSSAKTGEGCREIWKQVQRATLKADASKT